MHLAAALQRQVPVETIDSEELALDIDTPDDLRCLHTALANRSMQTHSELLALLAVQSTVAERA
jgi:2-phospho-L-lactate guanylyltransferase (CobY/MobA/RfbA family)